MKNMYKNSMLSGKLKIMNNMDKYILNEKNDLLPLTKEDVDNAEKDMNIKIPKELKEFYINYGYGNINDMNFACINRLIDPESCADIRLRRDYYKYDPELESYENLEKDKLIFFEVNEGIYLLIKLDDSEKNEIYYGDFKIADSLEEFLIKMYDDGAYYEEYVQEQYAKWEAENNE